MGYFEDFPIVLRRSFTSLSIPLPKSTLLVLGGVVPTLFFPFGIFTFNPFGIFTFNVAELRQLAGRVGFEPTHRRSDLTG